MYLQPVRYVLFRTEEVVHTSTTSQEDSRRLRTELRHASVFKDEVDALAPVLGGIVYRDRLVAPFRVDQRDKVKGSERIERILSFNLNPVVHEVDLHRTFPK